ncbi:hypothetical protein CU098_007828 [Rhizopus stolonifer]|uniref:Uncharacterized protein n=1 Tax=Rhizopus stolonifer TaxID=4846 RepID=A0A367JLU9_RHIST|nr:hypothetical protein CU098_007828 [Rhizopus stolonifer]
MLLTQPFDPQKAQQKGLPFLIRCRLFSRRTRHILTALKQKLQAHRQIVMMPDHRFMLTSQHQQLVWYGYPTYPSSYMVSHPPTLVVMPPILCVYVFPDHLDPTLHKNLFIFEHGEKEEIQDVHRQF